VIVGWSTRNRPCLRAYAGFRAVSVGKRTSRWHSVLQLTTINPKIKNQEGRCTRWRDAAITARRGKIAEGRKLGVRPTSPTRFAFSVTRRRMVVC
jgi:hypothetical protein